eukprot:282749-Pyramimonas_sp.AAC.1
MAGATCCRTWLGYSALAPTSRRPTWAWRRGTRRYRDFVAPQPWSDLCSPLEAARTPSDRGPHRQLHRRLRLRPRSPRQAVHRARA